MSAAVDFLTELFPELPKDTVVATWRPRPAPRSTYLCSHDVAAPLEGQRDVYVAASLVTAQRAGEIGTRGRPRVPDAAAVPGAWVDLDVNGAPDGRGGLKTGVAPSREAALDVAHAVLEPTIIVNSGYGLQAWYLLEDVWVFGTDEERDQAARIVAGFQTALREQADFNIDSTHDLARLMRLPGTLNGKGDEPAPVAVVADDGPRYSLEELATFASRSEAPRVRAPAAVAIDAELPRAKFEALCANVPEFEATWRHDRPDKRQWSDSEFDMALASYAARAGWTDDELGALISEHRRSRNGSSDRKADRPDYIARTVAKAREGVDAPHEDGVGELPVLRADEGDLAELGDRSWQALEAANDPPHLFRFGDTPSRIECGDEGTRVARPLDNHRMRYALSRAGRWRKAGKGGWDVPARVPMDAVHQVLATPDPPLPRLTRIVEVPVLSRSGEVVSEPGYHDGLYLAPAMPGVDVLKRPTAKQVAAAVELFGELIGDFPFLRDSDRATALGLLVLPFVRELIDGPTPLHLFEKPTPGTGATLLVEVLLRPFTGRPLTVMTQSVDDEEMRKRITAKLLQSPPYILFDNVVDTIEGGALSSALTASTWEDRLLGFSRDVRAPVRGAWIATGNNPMVSKEIARRTVRCRLDAEMANPHLREPDEFRHPDLRTFADENRRRLVEAALTLGRAWLTAGRPYSGRPLGGFEQWSEVVGGVLEVAGVPGFLENLVLPEEASDQGEQWTAFVRTWWKEHAEELVTVGQLLPLAQAHGVDLGEGESQRAHSTRLGKQLQRGRDTLVGPLRVRRGPLRDGYRLWRLEEV